MPMTVARKTSAIYIIITLFYACYLLSTVPGTSAPRGNSQASNQSSGEANRGNTENVDRIDGHDEIFESTVSADYECPICMAVLRDPVQTPCGHRFCVACINRHMA